MDTNNLTQFLANLNISTIAWFAVTLTIIRIGLIKMPGSVIRTIVEIVEAALIAGVLVFMIIQPFVVKAFWIPSGSMRTTLIDDDHILVDRVGFRLHAPHHDNVVVFNAPPQALEKGPESPSAVPVDYIKRLIGLPGDTIEVHEGLITINGYVYRHNDIRPHFGLKIDDAVSQDQQHLKFLPDGIDVYDGTKWTKYSKSEIVQAIIGSPTNDIQISPGYVVRNGKRLDEPYIAEDPAYNLKLAPNGDVVTSDTTVSSGALTLINGSYADPDQMAKIKKEPAGKVRPGEIIVMGDNRNDSNDSSRWGPLTEDRLVGRAFFIFYPFTRIRTIH